MDAGTGPVRLPSGLCWLRSLLAWRRWSFGQVWSSRWAGGPACLVGASLVRLSRVVEKQAPTTYWLLAFSGEPS